MEDLWVIAGVQQLLGDALSPGCCYFLWRAKAKRVGEAGELLLRLGQVIRAVQAETVWPVCGGMNKTYFIQMSVKATVDRIPVGRTI